MLLRRYRATTPVAQTPPIAPVQKEQKKEEKPKKTTKKK